METRLIGTDAEGIQLRILAHYLRNDDYVKAITTGSKEDKTDIHSVNRRALGLNHITRDHSKTFIYAFILGAAIPRVSRILKCSTSVASGCVSNFIDRTVGLRGLREGQIRRDAQRGYFTGLDGRRVLQTSEHLMLAGYLQNGESVIMKTANLRWRRELKGLMIPFMQINDVHDEWVTEHTGELEEAEEIGKVQCEAIEWAGEELGLYCPLAGETKIGRNWAEVH